VLDRGKRPKKGGERKLLKGVDGVQVVVKRGSVWRASPERGIEKSYVKTVWEDRSRGTTPY